MLNGTVSAESNQIKNVADPTDSHDVATKIMLTTLAFKGQQDRLASRARRHSRPAGIQGPLEWMVHRERWSTWNGWYTGSTGSRRHWKVHRVHQIGPQGADGTSYSSTVANLHGRITILTLLPMWKILSHGILKNLTLHRTMKFRWFQAVVRQMQLLRYRLQDIKKSRHLLDSMI